MTKFTKKPDEYEGKQWDGTLSGARELAEFSGLGGDLRGIKVDVSNHVDILNLAGMNLRNGDWILRHPNGSLTLVADGMLDKYYEEVTA